MKKNISPGKPRIDRRGTASFPLILTYHALAIPIKKSSMITLVSFLLMQKRDKFFQPHHLWLTDEIPIREVHLSDPSCTTTMNGTIAYGRSNCRTYDHVSSDIKISTPSGNFSMRQSFTCSSSYLIYCIRCTRNQAI